MSRPAPATCRGSVACRQGDGLVGFLVGGCLRRLLAGGAGLWGGVPVWVRGWGCLRRLLAGGAGLRDGLGFGMGLGWVVLAAIPSTSLRVITPAQGGPRLVVPRVSAL